jgi:hypothetical protein
MIQKAAMVDAGDQTSIIKANWQTQLTRQRNRPRPLFCGLAIEHGKRFARRLWELLPRDFS